MKKHSITLFATVSYELVIEAKNSEEAESKALAMWGEQEYLKDWEENFGNWDDVHDLDVQYNQIIS